MNQCTEWKDRMKLLEVSKELFDKDKAQPFQAKVFLFHHLSHCVD